MQPLLTAGLSALIVMVCAAPLCGQILNIDKTDTADYAKKPHLNLDIASGLEIDKQKATLYDATNTVESMLQANRELVIMAASYRFTYNGPDDILNAGYIHLRYRHNYKATLQAEPFAQYQWDNKRGIEHRALAGMNLRYNCWQGEKFDLNGGLGLMFEDEKWDYAAVDSTKIPVNAFPVTRHLWKINSYIRLDWKPSENSDLTFNLFLQTRPDRFQPRIAPHAQYTVKAGKHLGIQIAYTGLYDTRPVVPIEEFYYSLSNSVSYSF